MDKVTAPLIRRFAAGYSWDGVARLPYKEDGAAPFKAIARQTLFSGPDLAGELRYFEMAPGGHSTLERHEHVHAVMILRGRGQCLLGDEVREIGPHDLVTIPSWTWHQFRATGGEPLGFLCMVNAERDRPQLPTAEELAALRSDAIVARFLDGLSADEQEPRATSSSA
jgi:mannose-6-phosphate isomerase-like protein (cupin superfamily)